MQRRSLLKGVAGLALMAGTPPALARRAATAHAPARSRVRPYEPGWPTAGEWQELREAVGGRLQAVTSPLAQCAREPDGKLCAAALKDLREPVLHPGQAGGTQTAGWVDAWTSAPSVYAIEARKRGRCRGGGEFRA